MKGGIRRIFVASILLTLGVLDFGCTNYSCPEFNDLDVYDYSQLKSVITDYNMAYGTPPTSMGEMREFIEHDAKELGYQKTMTEVFGCDVYSIRLVDTTLNVYYEDSLFIEMSVIYGDVLYSEGKITIESGLKGLLKEIKKSVIGSIDSKRESYDVLYHWEDLANNRRQRVLLVRQGNDNVFAAKNNISIEMLNPFLSVVNSSERFMNIDSMEVVLFVPDTVPNRPPPPPL